MVAGAARPPPLPRDAGVAAALRGAAPTPPGRGRGAGQALRPSAVPPAGRARGAGPKSTSGGPAAAGRHPPFPRARDPHSLGPAVHGYMSVWGCPSRPRAGPRAHCPALGGSRRPRPRRPPRGEGGYSQPRRWRRAHVGGAPGASPPPTPPPRAFL